MALRVYILIAARILETAKRSALPPPPETRAFSNGVSLSHVTREITINIRNSKRSQPTVRHVFIIYINFIALTVRRVEEKQEYSGKRH